MSLTMPNNASPTEGVLTIPANAVFPDILSPALVAPSPLLLQLRLFWDQVDALYGGTQAMRLAGEAYLPLMPREGRDEWNRRLQRSTLYNAYKKTIQSGVARVFSQDVNLEGAPLGDDGEQDEAKKADVPPEIAAFAQDVDSVGRCLSQFAKDVLEDGINHGVSFILVDYSRVPEEVVTLADQQLHGARPYWVEIKAQNVLDARTANFSGVQRLSLFRYVEQVHELAADLLTPVSYQQIRFFRQDPGGPVTYAVYRHYEHDSQWKKVEEGEMKGVPFIPVVPFYTNRIGFFLGKPPLQDLADMNIHHWQVASDFTNINHIVNVPFLFSKGIANEMDDNGNYKELVISPSQGVVSASENADMKWIEHTGSSMESSAAYLKSIEDKMDQLGLALTTPVVQGGITATQNVLNAAEANSILKSYALSLQDTLNAALYFTAQFMGVPDTTRATVNTDYAVDYASDTTFQNVLDSFTAGVIDKETVISEGKRRNIFDPCAEIEPPEEEAAEIKAGIEKPGDDEGRFRSGRGDRR